jgi:hypothetical protein
MAKSLLLLLFLLAKTLQELQKILLFFFAIGWFGPKPIKITPAEKDCKAPPN